MAEPKRDLPDIAGGVQSETRGLCRRGGRRGDGAGGGEAGADSLFQVELLSWKNSQQAWIIELSQPR